MKEFFILFLILVVVVKGDADGYFWHISDNHMQMDYKPGSDVTEGCFKGQGTAGYFGDYNCRSPYIVERTMIDAVTQFFPPGLKGKKPDFILWTGDTAAKKGGHFSESIVKEELENVTGLLKQMQKNLGGDVPVFPLIGNHDTYPQHQLLATGWWVYDVIADLWKDFLSEDALKTLKKHGYYSEMVNPKLRILALNTVYYYRWNILVPTLEKDPGGQFAWMREQLKEAKDNGESVYIVSHIPPGMTDDRFKEGFIEPYLKAMEGYHDIIKCQFYGHLHYDLFELLGNITSGDFSVSLPVSTLGSHQNDNPSFRMITFDSKADFKVTDWTTFYMNLTEANKVGKITWKKLYSASEEYGLTEVTPKSMLQLANKIATDEKYFNRYYKHIHTDNPVPPCEGECKQTEICRIFYAHPKKFEKCLKQTHF